MTITLTSTSEVTMLVRPGAPDDSAIPARVWEGQTESGIRVQCLITRIAVLKTDDCAQTDAELVAQPPPISGERAFPLRMIL